MMKKFVTMRSLGQNGRFANQIFQYAFIYFYAQQHEINFQVPHWVGEDIFGLPASPIEIYDLPQVHINDKRELLQYIYRNDPFTYVDFYGYFQDIFYFMDKKNEFQQLFTPIDSILVPLKMQWKYLLSRDIIGLHLRYGDYGYGCFYETPLSIVLQKIEEVWEKLSDPVLYIATDDRRVCKRFKKFSPLIATDIFSNVPCPDFYLDFWALSNVNKLLITSNSSFSFAASMLNKHTPEMFRPSLLQKKLIPFTPWNILTPVILKESTPLLNFFHRHIRLGRIFNRVKRSIIFNI